MILIFSITWYLSVYLLQTCFQDAKAVRLNRSKEKSPLFTQKKAIYVGIGFGECFVNSNIDHILFCKQLIYTYSNFVLYEFFIF